MADPLLHQLGAYARHIGDQTQWLLNGVPTPQQYRTYFADTLVQAAAGYALCVEAQDLQPPQQQQPQQQQQAAVQHVLLPLLQQLVTLQQGRLTADAAAHAQLQTLAMATRVVRATATDATMLFALETDMTDVLRVLSNRAWQNRQQQPAAQALIDQTVARAEQASKTLHFAKAKEQEAVQQIGGKQTLAALVKAVSGLGEAEEIPEAMDTDEAESQMYADAETNREAIMELAHLANGIRTSNRAVTGVIRDVNAALRLLQQNDAVITSTLTGLFSSITEETARTALAEQPTDPSCIWSVHQGRVSASLENIVRALALSAGRIPNTVAGAARIIGQWQGGAGGDTAAAIEHNTLLKIAYNHTLYRVAEAAPMDYVATNYQTLQPHVWPVRLLTAEQTGRMAQLATNARQQRAIQRGPLETLLGELVTCALDPMLKRLLGFDNVNSMADLHEAHRSVATVLETLRDRKHDIQRMLTGLSASINEEAAIAALRGRPGQPPVFWTTTQVAEPRKLDDIVQSLLLQADRPPNTVAGAARTIGEWGHGTPFNMGAIQANKLLEVVYNYGLFRVAEKATAEGLARNDLTFRDHVWPLKLLTVEQLQRLSVLVSNEQPLSFRSLLFTAVTEGMRHIERVLPNDGPYAITRLTEELDASRTLKHTATRLGDYAATASSPRPSDPTLPLFYPQPQPQPQPLPLPVRQSQPQPQPSPTQQHQPWSSSATGQEAPLLPNPLTLSQEERTRRAQIRQQLRQYVVSILQPSGAGTSGASA